jgi:hypothetical protein
MRLSTARLKAAPFQGLQLTARSLRESGRALSKNLLCQTRQFQERLLSFNM